MQNGFPDQSSTAVASTLRLPAISVVDAPTKPPKNNKNTEDTIRWKLFPKSKGSFVNLYICVQSNTLASRGLEELFFQLCCCVSFWFWREIGFGFTYLLTLLNSLTAKSVPAGTKLLLFGRYVLNVYIGIVQYFLCKTKTQRAKIYLPTQRTNRRISYHIN